MTLEQSLRASLITGTCRTRFTAVLTQHFCRYMALQAEGGFSAPPRSIFIPHLVSVF